VFAAAGPPVRELPTQVPSDLRLPEGYRYPRVVMPGVLAISAQTAIRSDAFCNFLTPDDPINRFPLIVLVDDSEFTARTPGNFLWVTFTRSNPATDIHGVGSFIRDKHWGCAGSVVIDARIKPQHAPPLVEDSAVARRVDKLAECGGPLHGII